MSERRKENRPKLFFSRNKNKASEGKKKMLTNYKTIYIFFNFSFIIKRISDVLSVLIIWLRMSPISTVK